jgi:hypothetical protein
VYGVQDDGAHRMLEGKPKTLPFAIESFRVVSVRL